MTTKERGERKDNDNKERTGKRMTRENKGKMTMRDRRDER